MIGQVPTKVISSAALGLIVALSIPCTAGTPNAKKVPAKSPVKRAAVKKRATTITIQGIEMIYIPPGSFLMGCKGTRSDNNAMQHSVTLSGYYIGKYEVTRGQYRQFIDAGGYSNPEYWSSDGWKWKVSGNRTAPKYWDSELDFGLGGAFTQTDRHPVLGVTYYEAEAFCKWAGGHLPTEAQWEKAARWNGTHPNVYPWGDVPDAEKYNGSDDHNPAGGGPNCYWTTPVGSYPKGASPYGCQDMAGNVREWCKDWYGSDYYRHKPAGGWIDPQGPSEGYERVVRGGDFRSNNSGGLEDVRCYWRYGHNPGYNWNDDGFRVAR